MKMMAAASFFHVAVDRKKMKPASKARAHDVNISGSIAGLENHH
jgi:hypothetical protein